MNIETNKHIEELQEEFKKDVTFDDFNSKHKTIELVLVKQKWSARLAHYKFKLLKLKKEKKNVLEDLKIKIKEKEKIGISDAAIDKMANSSDIIEKYVENIAAMEIVIDFLERICKMLSEFSFDISNYVKQLELENV